FSHSLCVLPPLALLISWLYCRFRPDPFWSFKRVSFVTLSVLITHTLLDAMTTYGTQLLWPLDGYFELRNVFIIDPLYTLPLLLAIGV
ncbi:metal-dependent hydrolase, partial [Vibrio campbellii]